MLVVGLISNSCTKGYTLTFPCQAQKIFTYVSQHFPLEISDPTSFKKGTLPYKKNNLC